MREKRMAIEGFDYKEFAESLGRQAESLVPPDMDTKHKDFLIETMINFVTLSGGALSNDDTLSLNAEQAETVCQIIAEWTFHKIVDLSRSGIKFEYWDAILQKIAFAMFEICKQAILRKLSREEMLQTVEYHVVKTYKEAIKELREEEKITDEVMEQALKQSNIDTMSEKSSLKKEDKEDVFEELEHKVPDSPKISLFKKIKWFFCPYLKYKELEKELAEVRQKMQDLINPDKMYERLGVDIIGIQVGRSLLTIADPDQEGQLLAKTAALRQRLTDDYGYIIPSCRIQDNSQLEEYEYSISIRNNVVASGFVYPGKYMVIADQWDSVKKTIPEGAIVGVEPTYQTQAYWISEEDAEAAKNVTTVEATDVIITHLGECVIKYVDEIMTDLDIEKYIEHVKSENSSQINYLMEHLTVYDIRRILVNLIREKVSIKDIGFIFMKLCEFVIYTTETEALSKKLRVALARRICLQYVDTNNALYALDLSSSIEDILKNSIANTEFGTMFLLEPQQSQEIVEKIANKLMKAEKNKEHKPVILVSPKIRAALYEFLVKHIPTVVVLSYAELVETIKVEIIDTIE